ncbi:hypothetical protein [Nocardioides pacificus]
MTDARPDPDTAAEDSSKARPEESPEESSAVRGPRPSERLRRVLLAVLVLAVLVAGAALAWTLVRADGGEAQTARDDVMAQAEQFVLRVNNFGPDDLDEQGKLTDYQELVNEVITTKLEGEFAQGVPVNETRAAQLGETNAGDVYAMGVSRLDDDSATVLVAGGVSVTYDPPAGAKSRPESRGVPTSFQFRIQVQLVKVDGEWLVDEYTPLVQEP